MSAEKYVYSAEAAGVNNAQLTVAYTIGAILVSMMSPEVRSGFREQYRALLALEIDNASSIKYRHPELKAAYIQELKSQMSVFDD